jgi:hypothetical protein
MPLNLKLQKFYEFWGAETISVPTWYQMVNDKYLPGRPTGSALDFKCWQFWKWARRSCSQLDGTGRIFLLPIEHYLRTKYFRFQLTGFGKSLVAPEPPRVVRYTMVYGCNEATERQVWTLRSHGKTWAQIEHWFNKRLIRPPSMEVLRKMARRAWWCDHRPRREAYEKWSAWRICMKLRGLDLMREELEDWYAEENPLWGVR